MARRRVVASYFLRRFVINGREVWQVWYKSQYPTGDCSASGYLPTEEAAAEEANVLAAEDRLRTATTPPRNYWVSLRHSNGNLRRGLDFKNPKYAEGAEEPDWPGEDPQDTLKFGKP